MSVEIRGEEVAEDLYMIHIWNWTVPNEPVGFVVEEAPISGEDGWQGNVYYDAAQDKFLNEQEAQERLGSE